MRAKLKFLFQICTTVIFIYQATQALEKYFSYPVVVQPSDNVENKDDMTLFYVCKKAFNYPLARELGYSSYSSFLSGNMIGSDVPTWKGVHGNSSFQELLAKLYDDDYSKFQVNENKKKLFIFHQGYCLVATRSALQTLEVSTEKDILRIYPIHETYDYRITFDKTPDHTFYVKVEEGTYHFWKYELTHEIYDNTIFEGKTCVDYRKLQESYGDCLYRVFKETTYATYGCYPPWMRDSEKEICEENATPFKKENGRYVKFFHDINALTDGEHVDVMKRCPKPCYKVILKRRSIAHWTNIQNYSFTEISTDQESEITNKSVYSYDLFALITELGSSLGLWLGIILQCCIQVLTLLFWVLNNLIKNFKKDLKLFLSQPMLKLEMPALI